MAAESAARKGKRRLLSGVGMPGVALQPEGDSDRRSRVTRAYRLFFGVMGVAFAGLGLYDATLALNNTPIWLAAEASFAAAVVLLVIAARWDPAWFGPAKSKQRVG